MVRRGISDAAIGGILEGLRQRQLLNQLRLQQSCKNRAAEQSSRAASFIVIFIFIFTPLCNGASYHVAAMYVVHGSMGCTGFSYLASLASVCRIDRSIDCHSLHVAIHLRRIGTVTCYKWRCATRQCSKNAQQT